MKSIIKKLSTHEAQKIAAGEVVERPANIVKELIENALDAEATQITLTVRNGGKDFIEISDNGSGMHQDDALLCFKRHTTSKIVSVDQLESINTFGFRGEALASICSISKVTLTTQQKDTLQGTEITLKAGQLLEQKSVGTSVGTTITIDDLFYNVPARKKFLKATATEYNHIVTLFKAYALNNINVHFVLKHNDAEAYNCPKVQTVQERASQLFDDHLSNAIIPLQTLTKNNISVSGIITTQSYQRYDRSALFFFVNKRWVKNYQLANAVTKGYLNILQSGRYPAAALSIEIDPKVVDINVHPKKEEVQFLNPRTVASVITQAITETLEGHLSKQLKQDVVLQPSTHEYKRPQAHPFQLQETQELPPPIKEVVHVPPAPFTMRPKAQVPQPASIPEQLKVAETLEHSISEYQLIGQYRRTYLLLEHTDGLFILDQHAAHERILYERFKERFSDGATTTLMFPETISLSSEDISLIEPHLDHLKEYGIAIEIFSESSLVVKATPVFLKNVSFSEIIQEMVGWIRELQGIENVDLFKKLTERMRAQMACKAAVKAGDILSQEKMKQLLHDLETTNNRFTCPHGRPTSWTLTTHELEKKFKRKL